MLTTKREAMPTAKFLVYHHGTISKLKLRPGQSITLYSGGPHEEGYSYHAETFVYHAATLTIYRHWATDAKDCDGRMMDSGYSKCSLGMLAARWNEYDNCYCPVWERVAYRELPDDLDL
jgi:hypothetical protein